MTQEPQTLAEANRQIFHRYLVIVQRALQFEDKFAEDRRLCLVNLEWMCAEGAQANMADDKASRWLGFVQGCLAMRGLIDVDIEREITRPMLRLFHDMTCDPSDLGHDILEVSWEDADSVLHSLSMVAAEEDEDLADDFPDDDDDESWHED